MLVVSKSPLIVRRLDREGETCDQVLDALRAVVDAIELQATPELQETPELQTTPEPGDVA